MWIQNSRPFWERCSNAIALVKCASQQSESLENWVSFFKYLTINIYSVIVLNTLWKLEVNNRKQYKDWMCSINFADLQSHLIFIHMQTQVVREIIRYNSFPFCIKSDLFSNTRLLYDYLSTSRWIILSKFFNYSKYGLCVAVV